MSSVAQGQPMAVAVAVGTVVTILSSRTARKAIHGVVTNVCGRLWLKCILVVRGERSVANAPPTGVHGTGHGTVRSLHIHPGTYER